MRAMIATAAAMAVLSYSAEAQTVQQIMNGAKAAAVRQAANVSNYTVVQETNGWETSVYYEKKLVDGFPVFIPWLASVGARGGKSRLSYKETATMSAEVMASADFISKAKLAGTETVDGKRSYKIVVDDAASLNIVTSTDASAQAALKPKKMTMFLDATTFVALKTEIKADVTMNGQTREVSMTQLLQDYRSVQGVLLPYRTTVATDALGTMTPQERAEIKQVKSFLPQLPPEQRHMVEQMMAAMDASGVVSTVKSVRVNTGPPPM